MPSQFGDDLPLFKDIPLPCFGDQCNFERLAGHLAFLANGEILCWALKAGFHDLRVIDPQRDTDPGELQPDPPLIVIVLRLSKLELELLASQFAEINRGYFYNGLPVDLPFSLSLVFLVILSLLGIDIFLDELPVVLDEFGPIRGDFQVQP